MSWFATISAGLPDSVKRDIDEDIFNCHARQHQSYMWAKEYAQYLKMLYDSARLQEGGQRNLLFPLHDNFGRAYARSPFIAYDDASSLGYVPQMWVQKKIEKDQFTSTDLENILEELTYETNWEDRFYFDGVTCHPREKLVDKQYALDISYIFNHSMEGIGALLTGDFLPRGDVVEQRLDQIWENRKLRDYIQWTNRNKDALHETGRRGFVSGITEKWEQEERQKVKGDFV